MARDPEKVAAAKRRYYEKKKANRTEPEPITEARRRAIAKYQSSEKGRKQRSLRKQERLQEDPHYRLRMAVGVRLCNLLGVGNYRPCGTVEGLGCSLQELETYLTSHPNWNPSWSIFSSGTEWQLDHIRALCLYDMADPEQYRRAVHYTNLQPLSLEDHKVKTVEDIRLLRWFRKRL